MARHDARNVPAKIIRLLFFAASILHQHGKKLSNVEAFHSFLSYIMQTTCPGGDERKSGDFQAS